MFNQALYSSLFILLLLFQDPKEIHLFWFCLGYIALLIFSKLQSNPNGVQVAILSFFFLAIPYGLQPTSFFLFTFFYSLLYLLALGVFYYKKRPLDDLKLSIPFFLSFLIIAFGIDLSSVFPFYLVFLGIFLSITLLLPRFIIRFWRCEPFCHKGLEALSKKAQFKSRGFYYWNLSHGLLSAGILGIFPSSRYILITPRLTESLSQEALEAVIAHEIGHSQNYHLVLLPIILGASLIPLSFFPEPTLTEVGFYALFLGVYFRFVFGFFSRLFERQADLHGLKLHIPIEHMIEALSQVAFVSDTLDKPNWHHYSLHERIEFLNQVKENPKLALLHDQKVKGWLLLFSIIIVTLSTMRYI